MNYAGIVKISVMKGSKVVRTITEHNSGTIWLFKLLSSVLCGNNESANMPKYLDIGNIDPSANSGEIFHSNLGNRIPLTGKVINNFQITSSDTLFTGKYGAVFTAMIPSIQILQNIEVDTLRLYSTSSGGDEVLIAEVRLPPENRLTLEQQQGYNYMIDWVMTFENALHAETTASTY